MRLPIIVSLSLASIAISSCTNPVEQASLGYQQRQSANIAAFQQTINQCSAQYGATKASMDTRGPYELEPQADKIVACQNEATNRMASGMFFPADWTAINLLRLQALQDIRDHKKTRQIASEEVNQAFALAGQKENVEFLRRLGEANGQYMAQQQARSQALSQLSKQFQQPQSQTTSCKPNIFGGFDCNQQ